MQRHFKRESCRLCTGHNLKMVMEFPPTPIGDDYVAAKSADQVQEAYPLDLHFCQDCGQLQLLDVIDPELIYGEYMYETSISLGLREHFDKYAESLLEHIQPALDSLVVDIGCNDAVFLKCFKDKGMRVLGVEPAREIARMVSESGIDILNAFFSTEIAHQIKENHGPARIVSTNNVLANIDDLAEVANGVRELLAPDGVWTFETGYSADLIQGSLLDTVYHEHLCYFSTAPLVGFFQRYGLELIEIKRIPSKGGSLRGTVQLAGGPRTVSSTVSERVTWEAELGFDRAETYQAFAAKMEKEKHELLSLLRDLQAQGKTIAGYGASVGVTTLLYYFELGEILSFLLDDNPIKYNLLSPGHHIPVLPSSAIYERKPDYILVLAWRYVNPIMKRHLKYKEQGGHFIVPLPQIEIL